MIGRLRKKIVEAVCVLWVTNALVVGEFSVAIAAPTVDGFVVTLFAEVDRPRSLTVDEAGNIYTVGTDTGKVFRIAQEPSDADGRRIPTEVTSLGQLNSGYVGPHFNPTSRQLYVSKYNHGRGKEVLEVSLEGVFKVFANNIPKPAGLTSDAAGNVFVSSFVRSPNGAVFRCNLEGNCNACVSKLNRPDGLLLSSRTTLIATERGNSRLLKIPLIEDGSACGETEPVPISGPSDLLKDPIGITVDRRGSLIVADFFNKTLVKISPEGNGIIIGRGFDRPVGVVFDQSGKLYIADYGEDAIYMATPIEPAELDHFVCYDIRPPLVVPSEATSVIIVNQFERREIAVGQARLLCVPSSKTLVE